MSIYVYFILFFLIFLCSISQRSVDPISLTHPRIIPKDDQLFDELSDIVTAHPLFSALNGAQLNSLILALEPREYKAGSKIIRYNEIQKECFVLTEGTCSSQSLSPDGQAESAVSYSRGSVFGESALFSELPSPCTIKADSDITVWCLKHRMYRKVLVAAAVSEGSRIHQLLAGVPIFRQLKTSQLSTVAEAVRVVHYQEGIIYIYILT